MPRSPHATQRRQFRSLTTPRAHWAHPIASMRRYGSDRNGWWIEFGYETNRRQVRRCVISLKTILEHYGHFSDFSRRILAELS